MFGIMLPMRYNFRTKIVTFIGKRGFTPAGPPRIAPVC